MWSQHLINVTIQLNLDSLNKETAAQTINEPPLKFQISLMKLEFKISPIQRQPLRHQVAYVYDDDLKMKPEVDAFSS